MSFHEGDVVDATVSSITSFGAFVKLDSGDFGLIHISEISENYIKEVSDILKKGQKVKCKVISVDGGGKLSLSLKRVKSGIADDLPRNTKSSNRPPEYVSFTKLNKNNMDFEDMMSKYKKSSEEKISVLKKSVQVRRGSSRKNTR